MIEAFTKAWYTHSDRVRARFSAKHPDDYKEVVCAVAEMLRDAIGDVYESPDPERVHEIDDGDYQGTLVYVIGCGGYQPNTYWYVRVGYGSCSGCDTLEAIREYSDETPRAEQVKGYMTLALHIVQGLREMGTDTVY